MAHAAEDAIERLLRSKDMLHRDRICQTAAEQEFDLEHYHLRGLPYTEEENPHGRQLGPQKMFCIRDVARKALQVNGPTGENLQLRQQRQTEEQQRSDIKQRIEDEQKEAAAKLTPHNAVRASLQKAGVAPWNKLTKSDTLEKFNLEWRQLEDLGVSCESKPNPRNLSFKPMKLYRAGDVADALAGQRQQRVNELQQQRGASRAAGMLAARRAARVAAAAIEEAAEQ